MNRQMQMVRKAAAVAAVVMMAAGAMSVGARPAQADDNFPWLSGPFSPGGRIGLTFAMLRPRVLVTYGLIGPRLLVTFAVRRAR
jgi:hypothetical protein